MTTATPALRRERRGGRRRTRGQRLWSIVTSTALGALVLLAMLTQGVPLALGAQPYSVLTGSMRPGIPPGSLVAVRAVPFDDIRIGDIVTYQLESGEPAVVTHRVVGRSEASDGERMLTTRGDANNVADAAPVREVQVRGIVVYAVPLLGYPGSILNGPTRSGIVVGAGGAVVLYGLFVLGRSTRRGRKRAAAVVLALVGVVTPWAVVTPAPASAAAADDPLLVSSDGQNWVADGSVTIVDENVRLAPGAAASGQLWVRNDSSDDATATLEVSVRPASESPADIAAAEDIRMSVDDAPVEPGRATAPIRVEAGGERRLEIEAMLDWTSQNDSRRGRALVSATVRLTQAGEQSPPPSDGDGGGTDDGRGDRGAAARGGVLPATGGAGSAFALLGLAGASAIVLGLALHGSSRARRR